VIAFLCAVALRMGAFSSLFYADTDSTSALQALIDARRWLPSIDCDLIRKGEPDIVGPGVRSLNSKLT
jgi:hypothetical protein